MCLQHRCVLIRFVCFQREVFWFLTSRLPRHLLEVCTPQPVKHFCFLLFCTFSHPCFQTSRKTGTPRGRLRLHSKILFHLKCPEDLLGDTVQLIWLCSWTTSLFQEEVLQECWSYVEHMANCEGFILDWNLAGTYCNYHLGLNESKQSFLRL